MKPPLGPGRRNMQENDKQERKVKKMYTREKEKETGKRDNRGILYTEGR
jgi:hypothetical protein